jgi:type I pantothenate kinase
MIWLPPSMQGPHREERRPHPQPPDKGAEHCAKKLGEEAVETVIVAVENDQTFDRCADLLFHLLAFSRVASSRRGRGCAGAAYICPDLKRKLTQARLAEGAVRISDHRTAIQSYRIFTREVGAVARRHDDAGFGTEWLRSMHDRLEQEVEDIYLPLSPVVDLCRRHPPPLQAQRQFLDIRDRKVPTSSASLVGCGRQIRPPRACCRLLARWSPRPKVDLVTTDGFLFPNAVLERQGLMQKKGFPESYDLPMLLSFLSDIKAGRRPVRAPVYSHLVYDIVPNAWIEVDRPDILIVEGVNVLQTGGLPRDGKAVPVVSDLRLLRLYRRRGAGAARMVCARFLALRDTAFHNPKSYFHATRSCRTRRPPRPRSRSGSAPTSPISRTIFADPAARDADPEEARRSPGRDGGGGCSWRPLDLCEGWRIGALRRAHRHPDSATRMVR